jgi:hypothetical protein
MAVRTAPEVEAILAQLDLAAAGKGILRRLFAS